MWNPGLLQGARRWGGFHRVNGVVLDAAPCHFRKQLHDTETTLWMSCLILLPLRGVLNRLGLQTDIEVL